MSRRYRNCTCECGVKRLSCCCSLGWTQGTADVKAVGCLLRPVKASYFSSRAASEWCLCLPTFQVFGLKKKVPIWYFFNIHLHIVRMQHFTWHTHSTECRRWRLTPTSLLGPHWVFLILGTSTEWRRLRTHGTFALSLLKSTLNPGAWVQQTSC